MLRYPFKDNVGDAMAAKRVAEETESMIHQLNDLETTRANASEESSREEKKLKMTYDRLEQLRRKNSSS